MAKVLIVSKTKMANERVCVGGIDLDNKRSVRLLSATGTHETQTECPYNIGDIWDINYLISNRRPKPHTEDVNVVDRVKHDVLAISNCGIDRFITMIQDCNIPLFRGDLTEVFDGKLKITDNGSLYISKEDVSEYSTCFWVCDRNLLGYESRGRMKFRYNNNSTMYGYTISYVGLSNIPKTIPSQSLVRLSLAHWWSPKDSEDEERCYLQLSGCLIESDSSHQHEESTPAIDLPVKIALKGYQCKLRESVYHCYDNSDIHTLYLSLSKLFQGQDYLVMDKKVAEAVLQCKSKEEQRNFLAECRVCYSKEAKCYGVTLPITSKTIAEFVFDESDDKANYEVNDGAWIQTELRNFTAEEINSVSFAQVVSSQYGKSVCFYLKEGGQCYIPLDNKSDISVGEIINLSIVKIKTLSKRGEDDILRVVI